MKRIFIAEKIDRVHYRTLIPADYNPRNMDARTLRVLMGSLLRFGWIMPVVINRRTGNIVGGHQRARANAEVVKRLRQVKDARARDFERPPAIYVDVSLPVEKAMNVALNQISGDWDFFKKTAADQLRQNASYAQMRRKHLELGRGYRNPLGIAEFNFKSTDHRRAFRDFYGDRLLDFGAGGRQETEWINKRLGVDTLAFEPFPRYRGKPSHAVARAIGKNFLRKLRRGWTPDSVMCQFVISSIGHPDDRERVLTILSALTHRARQCVIAVRSLDDVCYQQVIGSVKATHGYLGIPDTTEPGLIVTAAGTAKQKFQKYFGVDEFRAVLQRHFGHIEQASMERRDSALVMVCRRPKLPVNWKRLEEALRFEFELKIDGRPMDLSAEALAAFRHYLSSKRRRPAA